MRNMSRMSDMPQYISERLPLQPLPRSSGNEDMNQNFDQDNQGVSVMLAQVCKYQDQDESTSLPDTTSDASARRKGLRISAPKFSDEGNMYVVSWCLSPLGHAEFNSFIGCLTGRLKGNSSRVKSESQVVAAGFTAR